MIIKEFIERIEKIHSVYLNMNMAYMLLETKINELMPDDSKHIFFGDGDPNDSNTNMHLKLNIGEFKNRVKKNGHDITVISNLCIVEIYQLWEDKYRSLIADKIGISKNELIIDVFGDIRILRRSIIHNDSKKLNEFNRLKILDFMKNRKNVYMNENEFSLLITTVKKELSNIRNYSITN